MPSFLRLAFGCGKINVKLQTKYIASLSSFID